MFNECLPCYRPLTNYQGERKHNIDSCSHEIYNLEDTHVNQIKIAGRCSLVSKVWFRKPVSHKPRVPGLIPGSRS